MVDNEENKQKGLNDLSNGNIQDNNKKDKNSDNANHNNTTGMTCTNKNDNTNDSSCAVPVVSSLIKDKHDTSTPNTTAAAAPTKVVRSNPATCAMESLLGSILRCTLDDGRIATGTFVCIDRLKNIILCKVIEQRTVESTIYSSSHGDTKNSNSQSLNNNNTTTKTIVTVRQLSQAMVPGKHLVKVEVDQTTYNDKINPIMC